VVCGKVIESDLNLPFGCDRSEERKIEFRVKPSGLPGFTAFLQLLTCVCPGSFPAGTSGDRLVLLRTDQRFEDQILDSFRYRQYTKSCVPHDSDAASSVNPAGKSERQCSSRFSCSGNSS